MEVFAHPLPFLVHLDSGFQPITVPAGFLQTQDCNVIPMPLGWVTTLIPSFPPKGLLRDLWFLSNSFPLP